MKTVFAFFIVLAVLGGCSATWSGVKQDTSDAVQWSKEKINEGAAYVKEKTE